ncbi:CPBP family intramembrane glutamic endopeptidase [Roseibacillus persicicus]|uniref:CAAX prenyl protease 2/Lysostaphin resistance protein A-like domain-containing protein n=1 Tax=Roseibacillus persicicus TaxID=454148 RepID=A0A918WP52_9BACT|nr:type II CAAX endopeptidase family protein [Roseibacillus persicicus]GHC64667.1 hypothetical protein GCM10007100_35380 [Roseibacillus persicicus]
MNDLYPYRQSSHSSALGEYRRLALQPGNRWLLLFACIALLFVVVRGYLDESDPYEVTWSATRMADVELSAAGHAESWPAWVRWLVGLETRDEALDWMAGEFAHLNSKNELTEEGQEAAAMIAALAKGDLTNYEQVDWEERYAQGAFAWERLAAERLLEENPPGWWLEWEREYRLSDQRTAWTAVAGSALWYVAFLVGLPFIPAALRCFQLKNHKPLSPLIRAWRPDAVTVRYILSDLLALGILIAISSLVPVEIWERHFGLTLIVTDSIWRLSGPILLALFLVVKWRHALRILGLTLRPVLPPIMGMVALGFLYDWFLYFTVGQFFRGEELNVLSSVEEGAWGLAFAIVSGVLLAPVVEEVVYRGFLFQSYARRFGFVAAVLLSTALFTIVHYYGICGSLSVAFFGFGACALYRATGSLWTGIVFHSLNNGLITLSMWPLFHSF